MLLLFSTAAPAMQQPELLSRAPDPDYFNWGGLRARRFEGSRNAYACSLMKGLSGDLFFWACEKNDGSPQPACTVDTPLLDESGRVPEFAPRYYVRLPQCAARRKQRFEYFYRATPQEVAERRAVVERELAYERDFGDAQARLTLRERLAACEQRGRRVKDRAERQRLWHKQGCDQVEEMLRALNE